MIVLDNSIGWTGILGAYVFSIYLEWRPRGGLLHFWRARCGLMCELGLLGLTVNVMRHPGRRHAPGG